MPKITHNKWIHNNTVKPSPSDSRARAGDSCVPGPHSPHCHTKWKELTSSASTAHGRTVHLPGTPAPRCSLQTLQHHEGRKKIPPLVLRPPKVWHSLGHFPCYYKNPSCKPVTLRGQSHCPHLHIENRAQDTKQPPDPEVRRPGTHLLHCSQTLLSSCTTILLPRKPLPAHFHEERGGVFQ